MLEIRQLPLNQLTPAPYNPRKVITNRDPAYRKLKRSLEEFGLVEPLIWNELSGHVVGGHLRLRLLEELGHELVPVSVVRLGPEREKALNILLNNQEAQGRYDRLKLADILEELQDLPELELTGFDANTLKLLRFEPEAESVETLPERVEISLTMATDVFEQVEDGLNAIIREHGLEVHVRRV